MGVPILRDRRRRSQAVSHDAGNRRRVPDRNRRSESRRGVSSETEFGSSLNRCSRIRSSDRPVRRGRVSRPPFDPDFISIKRRESHQAEVEGLPLGEDQSGDC